MCKLEVNAIIIGSTSDGYRDSWVHGQLGTVTDGYRCDSWVLGQTGTSGATNGYKCDKRVQGQSGTRVRQTGTGTNGYKCDKRVQRQLGTSGATNGYKNNVKKGVLNKTRTCVSQCI